MEHFYPPIGMLRTCFTEKFGVPRQSLMMSEARGILKLNPDPGFAQALNHLQEFSHVWVIFVFDKNGREWRPTIDPPRVGAPKNMGVFASRSPHRPNPIGISALKLDRIDFEAKGGIEIHLSGVDILDNTPVLDLKPYVPFADCIRDANDGWADGNIERYKVEFSPESLEAVPDLHVRKLIQQMLEYDPRPTSQKESLPISSPGTEGKRFAFRILDLDVRWQVRNGILSVQEIVKL